MINSILLSLEQTTSRNEKIAILSNHIASDTLQRVFYLGLNPLITFGIRKIPKYVPNTTCPTADLDQALDQLHQLTSRAVTGHDAIKFVTTLFEALSPSDASVLERVIQKDLRCGVLSTTCNAVWGNLIPDFPVMKATPSTPKSMAKIRYPAYSQMKVDGARSQIRITDTAIVVYSSSGNEMTLHGVFDKLADIGLTGVVLDGEMLVYDTTGKIMPRKKGNGIINKAIKGTITLDEAARLAFVVFDVIPEQQWLAQYYPVPYSTRYETLLKYYSIIASTNISNVSLVETVVVEDEAQAYEHFDQLYTTRKLEGTILKNFSGIWENTRSQNQVKLTGVYTCDLLVTGTLPGTGKNTGKIGALICQTVDGLLNVNVGSGLTDKDRELSPEVYIGNIIEVFYKERIEAVGGTHSLFSPRYHYIRTDKLVADTIDLIR